MQKSLFHFLSERYCSSANYSSFYAPFWPLLPQAFTISHLSFLVSGTPTFLLVKSHSKIHFCNIAYRKSRQLKHSSTVSTTCQASAFTVCTLYSIAFISLYLSYYTVMISLPQCIKSKSSDLIFKNHFGEIVSTVFESASCTSWCSQKGKYVQHYKYSIVPVCICGTCTYVMDINRKEQPI